MRLDSVFDEFNKESSLEHLYYNATETDRTTSNGPNILSSLK